MTSSVHEHYEHLLADYYTRMFGDFDSKVAEQQALLEQLGIGRRRGGRAVDLGCGSGFQSLALARLGYRVLAVDFSERLLRELKEHAHGLPIEAIRGDIRDVAILTPDGLDVAVCMGDTLSHLERDADLDRLFEGIRGRLGRGGRFVLTFRDLTQELHDHERVVPVRATDDLIMACFLEYEPETVKVHDLVWAREATGWRLRTGVYRKLRLAAGAVAARLEGTGFAVDRRAAPGGMVALVAVASD